MDNVLQDPNARIVTPAHDKFWDAHPTRREMQAALDHFSKFMDDIYASIDTQHIVVNFLAEKGGVTKAELEVYAKKKLEEVKVAAARGAADQKAADVIR